VKSLTHKHWREREREKLKKKKKEEEWKLRGISPIKQPKKKKKTLFTRKKKLTGERR
jgi:hypothetical protein